MAAPIRCGSRRFLFMFANEHLDFRKAEFESLAKVFGIQLEEGWSRKSVKSPFWEVNLSSYTDAEKLASRSVLIKSVLELWGQGATYPQMYQDLKSKIPQEAMIPYCGKGTSFKIVVETYNKKKTQAYKVDRIKNLPEDIFPLEGEIKLDNPENFLYLLEDFGEDHHTAPSEPVKIYFGRWLMSGQRERVKTHSLKDRCFIGNTSMDVCLSYLTAHMGKVDKNNIVFDPFVGTGSLLVPAAQYGSYVLGTDIDHQLLHAKSKPTRVHQKKRSKDESIRNNLAQYGLDQYYLDVVVADAAKSALWDTRLELDAIITDPPYGIREGAKKLGSEKKNPTLTEKDKDGHIPQKIDYHLEDIFRDLMTFSAKYLKMQGRLVFWLPVYIPDYSEKHIPRHPCLKLISNCEQKLHTNIARRLITMEKIQNYEEAFDVEVDLYRDESFRNKYFRKNENNGRKVYRRRSSSSRGSDCSDSNSSVDSDSPEHSVK